MTDEFLPEYHYMPHCGGYRPTYRLFHDKPFRLVPGVGALPTVGQALQAAKDYVREMLNSPVTSCVIEPSEELDEVTRWRRQRDEHARAERARVFGAKPSAPLNASGSTVVVETKRRVRV